MSQADGKVKIEIELDSNRATKELESFQKKLKGLGGAGAFSGMSSAVKTFGTVFNGLKGIVGTTAASVTAAVASMAVAFTKLYEASKQNFIGNLQRFGEVFKQIGSVVVGVSGQIVSSLVQIGGAPTGINDIIKNYADFTNRMQEVKAIMGPTNEEFKQLFALARQQGRDTIFTSLDAADALKVFAMAGWNAQYSMKALPGVLRAAQISGVELSETTSIIADTMTAMGMQASDANDMVDMMVGTFTNSNTSFGEMGVAMTYASQVAGTLKIKFEDLALATGLLANSGIKSSRAGTSLRTMLTNLAAPTDAAAKAMAKYHISLKTTKDGSVDLDATLRNMRKSMKDVPLKEQAAAAKALFGKTGMGGGLAIINASEEAYNRLQRRITGSTERSTYWTKECKRAGMSVDATRKKVDYLNKVFENSKDMADGLQISSTSLTKSISLLGEDGKVTSDNIESLFTAYNKLNNATDAQSKIAENFGISMKRNKNESLDYDKTINSLVKAMRGKTDEEKRAMLAQMGLSKSYDVLNELSKISAKRYDNITKAIDNTKSAAETAKDIIDHSLTFSAKMMASSLDDLGIVIMSKLDPALSGFCDWITKIASQLAQEKLGAAFKEYTKGLDDALVYIKKVNISKAIGDVINGSVTFLKGGGLSKLLNVGGEVIHQVCQGIIKNKSKLQEAISEAIKNIATFVKTHAKEVGEAGRTILETIKKGIEDNKDLIHDALNAVAEAMNSWISESTQINALAGNFADIFIDSFIQNTADKATGKAKEWLTALTSGLTGNSTPNMEKGGTGFLAGLLDWIFPSEADAAEKTGKGKSLKSNTKKNTQKDQNKSNIAEKLATMDTKEIKAFQDQIQSLEKVSNTVATSLSKTFTSMQNSMRSSMVGMTNIIRNQFLNSTNIIRNQAMNSANIVRNQFLNMTNIVRNQSVNACNIVRNQFVNMSNIIRNQSLNAANIVRNQFRNIGNIIKNQSTNARNNFTRQFISIKNVARVQSQEARNAVTRAMISMKNVVSTQSREARNNFTRNMISIKNVARTQAQQAGKYISIGLAQGLRAGISRAVAAARSMVSQVNAEIRKTAKIASPSRVTTEYGKFMALGLPTGFRQSMPTVTKQISGAMKGLQAKMRGAINDNMAQVQLKSQLALVGASQSYSTTLNDDDISRLENAISNRPTIVKMELDKKEVAKVMAEPLQEKMQNMNKFNERKRGRI